MNGGFNLLDFNNKDVPAAHLLREHVMGLAKVIKTGLNALVLAAESPDCSSYGRCNHVHLAT